MPFPITPNVHVELAPSEDVSSAAVVHVEHNFEPWSGGDPAPNSARELAARYLRDADVAMLYDIPTPWLASLETPILPPHDPSDAPIALRFYDEKSSFGTSVISFAQTMKGLPVWESGYTVLVRSDPLAVTSSSSSLHFDITNFQAPEGQTQYAPDNFTSDTTLVAQVLRLAPSSPDSPVLISTPLQYIYRFEEDLRVQENLSLNGSDQTLLGMAVPTINLPSLVGSGVIPNTHYEVSEVLFKYAVPGFDLLHWRMLVEVEKGWVLYLRALYYPCTGMVFPMDPLSQGGLTGPLPSATNAALRGPRRQVSLPRLYPPATSPTGTVRTLTGSFVSQLASPTSTSPNCSFDYPARTADFAAVNAYYHTDAMFQMVDDMGFNASGPYFDGTTFPVPMDYRPNMPDMGVEPVIDTSTGINREIGVAKFRYGVVLTSLPAQGGDLNPVGNAVDVRGIRHEFCHALLLDQTFNGHFSFAHSAGDSLAAILGDPDSLLTGDQRFITFPWLHPWLVARRHDREVALGWGWGGSRDLGGNGKDLGYSSEQILSTTLFRIYRSLGGDARRDAKSLLEVGDMLAMRTARKLAANHVVFLIIGAIALMGPFPGGATGTPTSFATNLRTKDQNSNIFRGRPGGTVHKVIDWSFQKQGVNSITKPVTTPGLPDVDVYIDGKPADSKLPEGEYDYDPIFWENTAIWNRHKQDGLTETQHQKPVPGVVNYAYARVKNRGTMPITDLTVSAYQADSSAGLVWPADFSPMTTPSITLSLSGNPLDPGDSMTVGPFVWTPGANRDETMLLSVSCPGDFSNIDRTSPKILPCAKGPTPDFMVVPLDNNIAMRREQLIPLSSIPERLSLPFSFKNMFERNIEFTLKAILPPSLVRNKWKIVQIDRTPDFLILQPNAEREVEFELVRGGMLSTRRHGNAPRAYPIRIFAVLDGVPVGGVTFTLVP